MNPLIFTCNQDHVLSLMLSNSASLSKFTFLKTTTSWRCLHKHRKIAIRVTFYAWETFQNPRKSHKTHALLMRAVLADLSVYWQEAPPPAPRILSSCCEDLVSIINVWIILYHTIETKYLCDKTSTAEKFSSLLNMWHQTNIQITEHVYLLLDS